MPPKQMLTKALCDYANLAENKAHMQCKKSGKRIAASCVLKTEPKNQTRIAEYFKFKSNLNNQFHDIVGLNYEMENSPSAAVIIITPLK